MTEAEQRQTLAADWNGLIRAGHRVTLRQFAAKLDQLKIVPKGAA